MTEGASRRYIDACVVTRAIIKEEGWEGCAQILKDAREGQFFAVTSTITIAEIVRRKGENNYVHEATIRGYFNRSHWLLVDLFPDVADRAVDYAFRFDLNPNDAIHLATAVISKCGIFYTTDWHFTSKNEQFRDLIDIREPVFEERHEQQPLM